MTETPRDTPATRARRLRPGRVLIKLVCAVLLLGGAAHARRDACDAGADRASNACLVRTIAARGPDTAVPAHAVTAITSAGANAVGSTIARWPADRLDDAPPPSRPAASAEAEPGFGGAPGDPPLAGLLLAALGVVAFVAHRRSGR